MLSIYQKIKNEYNRIAQCCVDMERQIASLPPGKLYVLKEKNKTKWWYENNGKRKYIRKCEREFAELMAGKVYLCRELDALSKEKEALGYYLRHSDMGDIHGKSTEMLNKDSGYRELLIKQFLPESEELRKWESEPFNTNEHHTENLIYKTPSGHNVRSKSELMIAAELFRQGIPYRYECELILKNGFVIYPDFTIRNIRTGKIYYWEHFGMMDNSAYAKNTGGKIQTYIENDIIPGVNLIMTFETSSEPLTPMMIDDVIRTYLM